MNRAHHFAFHVHSTWSYDGTHSLEGLRSLFKRLGYSGVIVTDHDRNFTEERFQAHRQACVALSTPDFALIPALEYSDPTNVLHLLIIGCPDFLGAELLDLERVQAAASKGAFIVFAHPARKDAYKIIPERMLEHVHGIEVWNRKGDGWSPNLRALQLAQDLRRPRFFGHDFHRKRQLFPLSLSFDRHLGLSEASILSALHSGHYQASFMGISDHRTATGGFLRVLRFLEKCRLRVRNTVKRKSR